MNKKTKRHLAVAENNNKENNKGQTTVYKYAEQINTE